MQKLEKRDIWFNSADQKHAIAGYFYHDPAVAVRAVVQLSHGMCEYVGRYEEFAAFLAERGIATAGNDHLGHGNSVESEADYGHFTHRFGRLFALQDLHTMNRLAHEQYPGVPVVMLGHSMGSFFARQYAVDYPDSIDALVICGTGGPNPAAGFGVALTALLAMVKPEGDRYRSELIHNIAFGTYLKRIEKPKTNYDWISRDEEIVRAYAADPKCTFRFTLNGFSELFKALQDVSRPHWAESLRKDLPIFVVAGEEDPVGNYGKGVRTVYGWLEAAGIRCLAYRLYPGMRHEILNEVGRQEVFKDIAGFIEDAVVNKPAR